MDYFAPCLWGIENRASLFDYFGDPTLVHQGLHSFMIRLTSDPDYLSSAILLTEQMSSLWRVVHDPRWSASCPNILRLKCPETAKPKNKELRPGAAEKLMETLWDEEYTNIKNLLFDSLVSEFDVAPGSTISDGFQQLFSFSLPPKSKPDLTTIGILPAKRVQVTQLKSRKRKADSTEAPESQPKEGSQNPIPFRPTKDGLCAPFFQTIQEIVSIDKAVFLVPTKKRDIKNVQEWKFAQFSSLPKEIAHFERMVRSLLKGEAKAALIGKVLLPSHSGGLMNVSKPYVQPGIITYKHENHQLICNWLQSTDPKGNFNAKESFQTEYLHVKEPHLQTDPSYSYFDLTPYSLFSHEPWVNRMLGFFRPQNFVQEVNQSEEGSSDDDQAQPKGTEGRRVCAKSLPNTPKGSPTENLPMHISEAAVKGLKKLLESQAEILSSNSLEPTYKGMYAQCLNKDGSWPFCATPKCKKAEKYALYNELLNKKPRYCYGCRNQDMVHQYNNLRGYLIN